MRRYAVSIFAAVVLGLAVVPATTIAQKLQTDRPIPGLEVVAAFYGPMPTGVTVSRHNRIFVNFPRWGDDVPFTVAEVVNGKSVAYPNEEVNDWPGRKSADPNHFYDAAANAVHFVSVQSVVVDPDDRLWVLDTGAPMLKDVVPNGPKLVAIDLATNRIVKTILLPPETAGLHSYMNDVRFDLRKGTPPSSSSAQAGLVPATADPSKTIKTYPAVKAAGPDSTRAADESSIHGFAYITDSSDKGPNGIVVVDLATGRSWRRLNNHYSTLPEPGFVSFAEGRPMYQTEAGKPAKPVRFGSDGIAISADGGKLFYCAVSSTKLYSVSTAALRDLSLSDDQVETTVQMVTGKDGSDGLQSDMAGNVYAGDYESDSIDRIAPSGAIETLVHDSRIIWPDTMSISDDGYLYVTSNQLNRQPIMHNGHDERIKPYLLLRIKLNAEPVRLK